MIRKVWAFPSKPSASPNLARAIRSRIRSPRCPNGGCPRSCALAAAWTTTGSQPPSSSANAAAAPDRTAVAMARATAVTLIVWVSRLCTTWPAAPCEITWVTAASREKYGENLIRSRSARNAPSVAASTAPSGGRPPGAGSANRRTSRGSMGRNLPSSAAAPGSTGLVMTRTAESDDVIGRRPGALSRLQISGAERAVEYRVRDGGQRLLGAPGLRAHQVEGITQGNSGPFGQHALGLLDHDSGVQRGL